LAGLIRLISASTAAISAKIANAIPLVTANSPNPLTCRGSRK
jgi:hypothetical protein